jgi:sugar phosphate isomerase/epimerase
MPLDEARAQITGGIAACLDHAAAAAVVLAIEPLHPMYAAERSAVNTVAQANAICAALGHHPSLGVALDVYHTWWDPDLGTGIAAAAQAGHFTAFHICDWMSPTTDLLNDRGVMGEGCIDVAGISAAVDTAGFSGFREVEVFSDRHWARDQHDVLGDVVEAYRRTYATDGNSH